MPEVLLEFICNAWSEILSSDLEITSIKTVYKTTWKSYSLSDLKGLTQMQVHPSTLSFIWKADRKMCFKHNFT